MKKNRCILFVVPLVLGVCVIAAAQEKATVLSNVMLTLAGEDQKLADKNKLLPSIVIVRADGHHVLAYPAKNLDGTYNMAVVKFMKGKGTTHDWPPMSRLMGHGDESRRLTGRFALQVVFLFDSQYPGGVMYMMDVDVSPPSWGAPVKTAKHLVKEHIPQDVFGKEKDQDKIAAGLEKRYGISTNMATATAGK
jgi:hypothetical protein